MSEGAIHAVYTLRLILIYYHTIYDIGYFVSQITGVHEISVVLVCDGYAGSLLYYMYSEFHGF